MRMRINRISVLLFIVTSIILTGSALAITVEKSTNSPVIAGETSTVKIKVVNDMDKELNILVIEPTIPEFKYLDQEHIVKEVIEGIDFYYLKWAVSISPHGSKEIDYSFISEKPGKYLLPKTKLICSEGVYWSDRVELKVLCNSDGFCNTSIENSINCPQDCPTGIKDGVCDAAKDNRVDPDCRVGEDPDDTVNYEMKIGEKHNKSDMLIYGIVFGGLALIIGVLVGIYKIFKRKRR